jgi:hypothetical protein
LTDANHNIYEKRMRRGVPISADEEARIKAKLAAKPHASLVARESKGAWSYVTV